MRKLSIILIVVAIFISSCCKNEKLSPRVNASPIEATLALADSAYALGSSIEFTMNIRNISQDTVELVFSTACRHAFEVSRGDMVLWNSLSDRMCAQIISRNKLAPGDSMSFEGRWDGTSAEEGAKIIYGEHFVEGVLMASEPIRTGRTAFFLVD